MMRLFEMYRFFYFDFQMIIEFKNLKKLHHPNIVQVYELYLFKSQGMFENSTILVVMELIEGKELFQVIQDLGHFSGKDFIINCF